MPGHQAVVRPPSRRAQRGPRIDPSDGAAVPVDSWRRGGCDPVPRSTRFRPRSLARSLARGGAQHASPRICATKNAGPRFRHLARGTALGAIKNEAILDGKPRANDMW